MPIHRRHVIKILASCAVFASSQNVFAQSAGFDHSYAAWDALLQKHVKWLPDGKQSRMDYRALAADRTALQTVLAQWSAVTPAQFAAFSRDQQMVFLINAYNGFTAELILTKYPGLKSIKDLGSFVQSPWKNKFFTLLGVNATWTGLSMSSCGPNTTTRVSTALLTVPALAAQRCGLMPSLPPSLMRN